MSVQVSYKKQTVLGIIGITILLLVIEVIANVWWVTQINCEFEQNEIFENFDEVEKKQLCQDFYNLKTSGDEIIPNQSTGSITINTLGFRGAEFFTIKPSDTYRIFMVGGSTMFGAGATSDETTIPGYLQQLLNEKDFGFDIEIIYSGKIKKKNQLPDLVINFSEDAWFGRSIGPHQHFTKAIYRSIEEGVFIARSANKGISAFVNPNGRVLKSLNTRESGNIELNFPHFSKSTLFSKYGNKIFFLIILLYIFLTLIFKKLKI